MTGSDRLRDLRAYPAEGLRLLAEAEERLVGQPPETSRWCRSVLEEAAGQIRAGELEGTLLVGPKDEAVAVAYGRTEAGLPRRLYWIFSAEYDAAAPLRAFLTALEADAPLLGVWDLPPLSPTAAGPVLAAAGFRHHRRIDLRRPASAPLPDPLPVQAAVRVRALTSSDGPSLARLLGRAYRDNPMDRALFVRTADAVEEARRSVHELLSGEIGPWRPEASMGVFVADRLAAATIVLTLDGPLVAEVMTDPDHRRRGFARRALVATIRALAPEAPRLVVTEGNDRAESLYRALGFEDVPAPEGGIWVRPEVAATLPVYPEEPGSGPARPS